jgi:hypothetical protein
MAVHPGQHQIQQQEVKIPSQCERQSGLAIAGYNTEVALGAKPALKEIGNARFVFNYQDSHAIPFSWFSNDTRMRAGVKP